MIRKLMLGFPMKQIRHEFDDHVVGMPVYSFMDRNGKFWLAHSRWDFMRVKMTGSQIMAALTKEKKPEWSPPPHPSGSGGGGGGSFMRAVVHGGGAGGIGEYFGGTCEVSGSFAAIDWSDGVMITVTGAGGPKREENI